MHSADGIDVVMAFIRKSGIAPLVGALRSHCSAGRGLGVLTTTYTNSTEGAALDLAPRDLRADVRVSYDVTGTRLHAKSWLFYRSSGFSTAYIGFSNLTHSAQVTGLEWNVRISGARNPDVIDKVAAVFESYWNGGDFIPYDADMFGEDSETALRYRNHGRLGTSVLLFARLRTDDRAFWFLGPATYVKHESETPMSVTWRLEHLLPGDVFEQFAAAVA